MFDSENSKVLSTSVKYLGQPLFNFVNCKYMGVMLTEALPIYEDVARMTPSFLKHFKSLIYKFTYVGRKVLTYLFRAYTSSFCGLENWKFLDCKTKIQKLFTAYHKVVKIKWSINVWKTTMMLVRLRRLAILNICVPSAVQFFFI